VFRDVVSQVDTWIEMEEKRRKARAAAKLEEEWKKVA
jgi:hypothetical protein